MAYQPQFTISPALLMQVEAIAALRDRIQTATVQVAWIPALQKDARTRTAHSSTAIEGNPLTLEEVRAIEQGDKIVAPSQARREVLNYFAALRHVERQRARKRFTHEDVFHIHALIASDVVDTSEVGRYRTVRVSVGPHVPPPPDAVSGLMFELLQWWNDDAVKLSPVLSAAILHLQFETIHPFADGNGRTGRVLALWELYRRGFDSHHIFAVDEFYWQDRPRYYAALDVPRREGGDLTSWLEYCAEGVLKTLERAWDRMTKLSLTIAAHSLLLRPRQEQLLQLLGERGGMAPAEIWTALNISKQGALDLLNPLIEAGLVKRTGTRRDGRYILV